MTTLMRSMLAVLIVAMAAATLPAQTPATRRAMREKLTHSQQILGAILTSDYALLERETAALAMITDTSAWTTLKGPEYVRQSELFLQALRDLEDASGARDLDAAAEHYSSLTLTCFNCHRYMKGRRLADR